MKQIVAPTLDELWPFEQVAVPSELSGVRVDRFFATLKSTMHNSIRVTEVTSEDVAPIAAYAIKLSSTKNGLVRSVWSAKAGAWVDAIDYKVDVSLKERIFVIEFNGVLLGNVTTPEELSVRVHLLFQKTLATVGVMRLFSRLLAVFSIMMLFYAIRIGVEASAIEPFAVIFAAAFSVSMAAVYMRQRCRSLIDTSTNLLQEQFLFEYNASSHSSLKVSDISKLMKGIDRTQEEKSVVFGFCLLLTFVYFISPLIVVAAIVSLFLGVLLIGSENSSQHRDMARRRAVLRLENAVLSFRTGNDLFAPPILRSAKKSVLRDRLKRFEKINSALKRHELGSELRVDLAHSVALIAIVGAYVLPLAVGVQQSASNLASSFETVSLFSVAPVIVLISISKATVATSIVTCRKIDGISRTDR